MNLPLPNDDYLLFPLTDGQRMALMLAMLVLIILWFVVIQIPAKRVRKDPWKNVRHRNRKKTPPSGKNGKR